MSELTCTAGHPLDAIGWCKKPHDRLSCTDDRHVLACYNSWFDETWCQCGKCIPGKHSTWHEDRTNPADSDCTTWTRHVLASCTCHPDGIARRGGAS